MLHRNFLLALRHAAAYRWNNDGVSRRGVVSSHTLISAQRAIAVFLSSSLSLSLSSLQSSLERAC